MPKQIHIHWLAILICIIHTKHLILFFQMFKDNSAAITGFFKLRPIFCRTLMYADNLCQMIFSAVTFPDVHFPLNKWCVVFVFVGYVVLYRERDLETFLRHVKAVFLGVPAMEFVIRGNSLTGTLPETSGPIDHEKQHGYVHNQWAEHPWRRVYPGAPLKVEHLHGLSKPVERVKESTPISILHVFFDFPFKERFYRALRCIQRLFSIQSWHLCFSHI